MSAKRRTLTAVLAIAMGALMITDARAMEWDEIQTFKRQCLESAARNAMANQKTDRAADVPLNVLESAVAEGGAVVEARQHEALAVRLTARPLGEGPATEVVRLTLREPVDMIAAHSGLAMTVRLAGQTSPEVRLGVRLIGPDGTAVIRPVVPAASPWGDNPHEVYFDWAFINYRDAEGAVTALRKVHTIEITAAGVKRAPQRGPSDGPQPAAFILSDLRVVDYLKGSFDPSRHRWQAAGRRPDLTLQHRCQEITGVVARFGGPAGPAAAVASLDHVARTQCWDGSFLDGRRGPRTVASGEYTYGFTMFSLLNGYETLEKAGHPALDQVIAIGPATMARREAYQRMFYRGAMSRTAALPSQYRDDIIGGDTLMTGANRVLGYAIAMRIIADSLTDAGRAAEVMKHYQPIMQQIADAQGRYSGGFPVLGEGDRYRGRGIHYDGGYTRTHMDWLVNGVIRTGDPLLVQMLRRYQTVFEAVMNTEGRGLQKFISERHPEGGDVQLILPHATYQVGVKHNLPIIAQWGYNVHRAQWEEKVANHFTFASHAEGYSLGAHIGVLFNDLAAEPAPADLGYRFPREYPIWSSRLYTKQGELVRTSRLTIGPDGTAADDFRIEVGEYPVTVGVPVKVRPAAGAVRATAVSLTGWPALLPEGAQVVLSGDVSAAGRIDEPIALKLQGPTRIVITGPAVALPAVSGGQTVDFRAELTLEPETPGTAVTLTVLNGTE
ncbi:MAG: hypothetical protein GX591_17765 [Planctomycetes bacterium]|nr:hypothetical protein [Planctomycetota bacterium]